VLRGGSFYGDNTRYVKSAGRILENPTRRDGDVGFRVATTYP